MNLELIIPPYPYLSDQKRNISLGILYLGAVAEKEGYNVKITDLRDREVEEIPNLIGDADVYGFTANTADYPLVKEIAKIVKNKNEDAWRILGGIHATSLPNNIDSIFQKVVIGEGENSLLRILGDYEKGNDKIKFYQSDFIKDINNIPFPAWHLLPFESVFSKNGLFPGAGYTGTIMTSRGCPSNCAFCASKKMWKKKVRFRNVENVEEEIKKIVKKYNVKNFRFQDDTLTFRKKRLEDICERIKPYNLKWRAGTRVDQINPEILKIMKEAGCEEISYGAESLSQNVLDRANKKQKVEEIYKATKMTKDAGIMVRLYFIIGLPGERPGFAEKIMKLHNELKPEALNIHSFVPYPGSPSYENPEKYGINLKETNLNRYIHAVGLGEGELEHEFVFYHDIMSEEQLKLERKKLVEFFKVQKVVKNF